MLPSHSPAGFFNGHMPIKGEALMSLWCNFAKKLFSQQMQIFKKVSFFVMKKCMFLGAASVTVLKQFVYITAM